MPPQNTTSRFSFEQASVGALVATLILSAVIFVPFGTVPFAATKAFVLASGGILSLAFYILARLTRGNVIFPPIVPLLAMWLPALGYGLSTLFSGVDAGKATFGTFLGSDTFGFILTITFLGTLTALSVRRVEQYQPFLKKLAYALGFILLAQIIILIVGNVSTSISPAFSIVGSLQDLGILLGLGIIGGMLTLRLSTPSVGVRRTMFIFGILALFLLAIINSTLVWVMLALSALGLFVEAVMLRRTGSLDGDLDDSSLIGVQDFDQPETGHRPLATPLAVLAVSLFFIVGSSLGGALANKFNASVLSVRPSWQATLDVGSNVYSSSAVFGSGPGTFGAQWSKYRDASVNQTVFWNVDFTSGIGFVPTSFVTTGILGTILWLMFFGLFLFYGIRTILFRASENIVVRNVTLISFVGTLYLSVATIFVLPSSVVLALTFVFLGIFVSSLRFATRSGQWGVVFARSPRVGFVVVFKLTLLLLASIVAAYSLVGRYIAQVDIARAGSALSAGDLDAANKATNSALTFVAHPAAYQIQSQIAQARLQLLLASTTLSASEAQQSFQNTLSAGINAALTATRVDGANYQNWLALGNLYATVVPLNVDGAYDNAKTAYEKAVELYPTSASIQFVLGQLAVAGGDSELAQEYLKKAIALKQNYTAAIFLLSQLEVAAGNLNDALASAEAAAYFTPNNQNVLFQLGLLRAAKNNTTGAIQALSAAVRVNPNFANARYFLAAAYAKQGDLVNALREVKAVADLSEDNAIALASTIQALASGENPFPANLLSIEETPIEQ